MGKKKEKNKMNNDNKEFEEAITLKPKEYEDFIKYQKSLAIEAKRKEIRGNETKISNSRKKIKALLDSENNLKKELSTLLKSK